MRTLRQAQWDRYEDEYVCYDPEYGEVVKIQAPDGTMCVHVMKVAEGEGCSNCPLNENNGEYNCSYIPLYCGMYDSYVDIGQVLEDL